MPHVFRTKKGGEAKSIAGVGGVAADGGSVLSIDEAALVMPELQEKDARGLLKLKDGKPIPLTGKAVVEAAKEFAERHDLEVANVKEEELGISSSEQLRQQSIRRYKEIYGDLKPVNNDPDELATSGADPAAIAAAPTNPAFEEEGGK